MKLSKRQLRKIIKEEKARLLREEAGGAPCPHATAAALMDSGMSAGDILGWINNLVSDLSQAEVSAPVSAPAPLQLPNDATVSMSVESRKPRRHPTIPRGTIPGIGFKR